MCGRAAYIKEASSISQPGFLYTSRPPPAFPWPSQQTCPPTSLQGLCPHFSCHHHFSCTHVGSCVPPTSFPQSKRVGGAHDASSESLLRPLPHCFVRFCLSTRISWSASVFLPLSEAGGRTRMGWGRELARSGELVSLFPENECNFHSFPQEAGSMSSSGRGVAVVSNGPGDGSALGLYLMPQP